MKANVASVDKAVRISVSPRSLQPVFPARREPSLYRARRNYPASHGVYVLLPALYDFWEKHLPVQKIIASGRPDLRGDVPIFAGMITASMGRNCYIFGFEGRAIPTLKHTAARYGARRLSRRARALSSAGFSSNGRTGSSRAESDSRGVLSCRR